MLTDVDSLLDAVDKIADTSFDATKSFGANVIAARRSGSRIKGFYRPGERPEGGAPFEVLPTKLPKYNGRPSGRAPSETEKRNGWPLQDEYLAGRLGKDTIENSKLWNTAKWIDRHQRIVTTPANAVQAVNLLTSRWQDVAEHDQITDGFGVELIGLIGLNAEDWKRIDRLGTDILRLIDELEELDELGKIDADKLLRQSGPRPLRVDFPDVIDRTESGAIVETLQLGMRTLWTPVKRAIADHTEMFRLGLTEGARREIAPAVGRQRVIEGLRIADSIRKDIARQKNPIAINEDGFWPARRARERRMAAVDRLIKAVLEAVADAPLHPNDNYSADNIGFIAA